MKFGWSRCCALAALVLMAGASPVWAADPSAADKAAARALFDEGRSLSSAGRYAEACVKLEESQKLDPGFGTMFNLADCYEHVGQTATAWAMYLEVAGRMRSEGQKDREQAARERAAAIEPKLSRVIISVAPEVAQWKGVVVKRDGAEVGRGVWGSAIPVDPGSHVIEATAPGKQRFTQTVEVGKDGARVTINIPVLQPEASGPAPVAPARASASNTAAPIGAVPAKEGRPLEPGQEATSGSSMKTIGLVVAGAGVVGVGVGTVLAFGAKSKFNESSPHCDGNKCSQEGVDIRDEAISKAGTATIVGGIGLAALVGGAVLYFTAPSAPKNKTATLSSPAIAIGPGSVTLSGRW